MLFLDTSALVKLYVRERGTTALLARVGRERRLSALSVARLEFYSALRRRTEEGNIEKNVASSLAHDFDKKWELAFLVQDLDGEVIDKAVHLVKKHALRAYDAAQLAACLVRADAHEQEMVFACSDERLNKAAREEGLEVFNPEEKE